MARFLEGQGLKDLALEVATDPDHKFDLALSLNRLDIALELARAADVEHKWKAVGDAALTAWDVPLATESFTHSKDLGSLLLLHSSTGDRAGLEALDKLAVEAGVYNVAFNCRWLLGDVDGCIDALVKTGRLTEAAFFAQTYKPSAAPAVVGEWKQSLDKAKKGRVAKMIAVPGEDDELFPAWDEWLQLEKEGGSADPATLAAAAATNGAVEEEEEETEEEPAEEEEEGTEDEDE